MREGTASISVAEEGGAQASVAVPSIWLKGFADRVGSVDRRPLFGYRSSYADFLALQQMLRTELKFDSVPAENDPFAAACFCLYAAEWWRREYQGHHWSWNAILDSLSIKDAIDRPLIYALVVRGLDYWQRPLLKTGSRRAFLVTLAYEGGLPLKLIEHEGTRLWRYFRALLEEFQVFGNHGASSSLLAANVERYLPPSFRRPEVHELAGALIERIWRLQSRVVSDAADPVAALHQVEPGWERDLPLSIEDNTARSLLTGLVRAAREVAITRERQFEVCTWLREEAAGFSLERAINLPSAIRNLSQLCLAMNCTVDALPSRLQIYVVDQQSGKRLLAHASRLGGQDRHPGYLIEQAWTRNVTYSDMAALSGVQLSVSNGGASLGSLVPVGGQELSDLPWVFTALDEGDASAIRRFRLVGEGSVRSPQAEVLVAVPATTVLHPQDGSTLRPVGDIERLVGPFVRSLFLLRGKATWQGDGENCTISTDSERSETREYRMHGERLWQNDRGQAVYRGMPRLSQILGDGVERSIPRTDLEWRPHGGANSWHPLSDAAVGDLLLRHVVEGETVFRRRLCVLPTDTKIEFHPGQIIGATPQSVRPELGGSITITMPIPFSVASATRAGITAKCHTHGCRAVLTFIAQDRPPPSVSIHLRWANGQHLVMEAPYPAVGMRFIDRNGEVLPNESRVHWERLDGIKIEVLALPGQSGFKLWGRMQVAGPNAGTEIVKPQLLAWEIPQIDASRFMLELGFLRERAQLMLSMTHSSDSPFVLWVESSVSPQRPSRLHVTRFEGELIDQHGGRFAVKDPALNRHRLAQVRLQAMSICNPRMRIELNRQTDYTFALDPSQVGCGPWLILGWEGMWCRFRPLLYASPNQRDAPPAVGSLEAACEIKTPRERRDALGAWVQGLVGHLESGEWTHAEEIIDILQELPPTTLDQLRVLAERPNALTLLALRVSPQRLRWLWYGLRGLPFSWALVPVSCWVHACRQWTNHTRTALEPSGLSPEIVDGYMVSVLSNMLDELPAHLPAFHTIAELVRHRVLNEPVRPGQSLFLAKTPQGREYLIEQIEQSRQALLNAHDREAWPQWSELEETLASLRQELLESIRALLDRAIEWAKQAPQERRLVLCAPLIAACISATNLVLPHHAVLAIRLAEAFDPVWFGTAHAATLTLSIHLLLADRPELLDV